jgi:hypothetical protein
MARVKGCKAFWNRPQRWPPAAYAAGAMDKYENPYREVSECAPLTRVGRLAECVLGVLLALLAVYLSR